MLHAGRPKYRLTSRYRNHLVADDGLQLPLQYHHRLFGGVHVGRHAGTGGKSHVPNAQRVGALIAVEQRPPVDSQRELRSRNIGLVGDLHLFLL